MVHQSRRFYTHARRDARDEVSLDRCGNSSKHPASDMADDFLLIPYFLLCVDSSYTGGYRGMAHDLGSSRELSTGGMSTYIIGLGLGGFIWSPASEVSNILLLFKTVIFKTRS